MENTLQIKNISICKGYSIKVVGEYKEISDKLSQINESSLAGIFEHIKVLKGRKRKLTDSKNRDSLDNWAGWQSYLIHIIEFLKNYKVSIE